MKALILSCNTGQGHNSAGKALLEEFARRGLPCEMKDALAFGQRNASRIVSFGYIRVTQRAPLVFGGMYRIGSVLSSSRRKSPVYLANIRYANHLAEYITQNNFDTVLCPHLFPAEALTYLRRRCGLKVRSYGVATDYTCSPFWEETDIDRFFIPHADLLPEYQSKGFSSERLAVTGIPVASAFRLRTPAREARAALQLPPDGRLYLIMTGSMGFGDTGGIAAELLQEMAPQDRVLALVGSNTRLSEYLAQRFEADARLIRVPFTSQVPLYMDACDVVLTKPGGLSSTEAAVKNVALVHTAPIPGCETENARFFSDHRLCIATRAPRESALAALELARNGALREQMQRCQREHINPYAAATIVDLVLENEK